MLRERDELLSDLRGYQQEIEGAFKTIKTLKAKNRKTEEILYGRKIGSSSSMHFTGAAGTIGGQGGGQRAASREKH